MFKNLQVNSIVSAQLFLSSMFVCLVFSSEQIAHAEGMNFDALVDMARTLAKNPYHASQELELPQMGYAQFHDVLFRPERAVWKDLNLHFQLQFFPVGWIHKKAISVYEVVDGEAHPMPISAEMFNHIKDNQGNALQLPNAVSGFRVHTQLNPKEDDEFLVFMGASYFRALARGMGYGISARGLALNTAHPDGEEFPEFTTFVIERPSSNDSSIKIGAILDGPSVTGAYQLTANTGDRTEVMVRATIFMRKAVKQLGIAPLTSMFWYGENSYPRPQDYRPEVHDSDGLLIGDLQGEWIWRPLLLSPAIRHCAFETSSLKGFGLLLRDRNFDHYQDLGAHNESRPSLWVEPLKSWGLGRVHLVEIPTDNEFMDNVVAFWEPTHSPTIGEQLDLQYKLTWLHDETSLSPLGKVIATRRTSIHQREDGNVISSYNSSNINDLQEFVVDFSPIANVPLDEQLKPEIAIESTAGGEIVKSFVVPDFTTGGWRVFTQVRFTDPGRAVELNLKLLHHGQIVTEKWNYLWQP